MDPDRRNEITAHRLRILDPFSTDKLRTLGEAAGIRAGDRVLDLGCGRGELLCRWASWFGTDGVGVDVSPAFVASARDRAAALGVADRVTIVEADAATYPLAPASFDAAACLGATWIGGGLIGTLRLLGRAVRPGGTVLVGEPFWREPPSAEALAVLDPGPNGYASLAGTLERFAEAGIELVEMVLASEEDWDRYEAGRWHGVIDWVAEHPDDPDAPELRAWVRTQRDAYLRFGRRHVGWGAFVLRAG